MAWFSDAFYSKHGRETPYNAAPEICVEILSLSNSLDEMEVKRALYFEVGATEVWECDQDGVMSFYGKTGKIEQSEIAAEFPTRM